MCVQTSYFYCQRPKSHQESLPPLPGATRLSFTAEANRLPCLWQVQLQTQWANEATATGIGKAVASCTYSEWFKSEVHLVTAIPFFLCSSVHSSLIAQQITLCFLICGFFSLTDIKKSDAIIALISCCITMLFKYSNNTEIIVSDGNSYKMSVNAPPADYQRNRKY